MTAEPTSDTDQTDILFDLHLYLEAAAPETSVHQLFTRAIAEIERLQDTDRISRENVELRARLNKLLPPMDWENRK